MAFNNLQGKTAIVTGAGAGINLCFAKLLLSKGCNVIFADLKLTPGAQEVVDAHQTGTPRAVFQETDVTNWTQIERLFPVCEQHFGSADIVCPGAGVFEPVCKTLYTTFQQTNTSSHSRTSGSPQAPGNPKTPPTATTIPP